MSKFLNVPNGDYKLTVQDGGEIKFDTGPGYGTVVITGDLRVEGGTTTVRSEDMVVKDNIIVVNDGETNPGVTLGTAGLRVDRGSLVDAQFIFDESITWDDPISQTLKTGAFTFRDINGALIGVRLNSIDTAGGDLYLINKGNGVISVSGTNNYEEKIFTYTTGTITGAVIDDDNVPNTKAVVDYVDFVLANTFQNTISGGSVTPTYVETLDFEETGSDSVINFGIDNVQIAQFYADRFELGNVTISDTTISSTVAGQNLVLTASTTGTVQINDVLEISTSTAPAVPVDGIRLYASPQSYGKTGLYFVNSENNQDELISKNRSLLYSMIF